MIGRYRPAFVLRGPAAFVCLAWTPEAARVVLPARLLAYCDRNESRQSMSSSTKFT